MKKPLQMSDSPSIPMVLHARTVTGTGGGPEKTILNSPRHLRNLGYKSECLFLRPKDDAGFEILRQRASEAEASLIEIDDVGKFSPKMVKEVIRHVRSRNVTIWHAHDYKSNLLGIVVNRFHPMRLITTVHGWVNFDGMTPLYYWLDKKFFLPRYESVICVSSTVMEQAIAGGTPESRCTLIENAIDHEQFARTCSIVDAKQKIETTSQDTLLVGSIGRLSTEKGFDLLIEAVSQLVKSGLDVKLRIAGEGPEKQRLDKQIHLLGMEDRIELLGFCSDTRAFYESLDVFVLSSHREGLPNVVLEAMAVGAPVIATSVDGVPRIITHGIDGILVPPGCAQSIANEIRTLASDHHLQAKLSSAATLTIQSRWSFANRMKKIRDVYSETK